MPTPSLPWLLTIGFVVLVAWYLTFSATRLDRLHARVEGARSALDAQLVRRASVTLQLAASGRLDPATSLLLADAAHEAREADTEGSAADGAGGEGVTREQAESDLTGALRAAFADPELVEDLRADPVGRDLLRELAAAGLRVQLARRFHNDVVRSARVVRRKRVVRYLRLAGHAPWPQTFEMSDTPPVTLASGAVTSDAYRRST
ncbi:MAG TPA: hypothetical protein VFT95_09135 [Micromonosporaceae bacterium]|nr:hypothetical protein [Micromonosporaceae bacterium]